MAIYKCDRGAELGSTVNQFQIAVRAGLEDGTSGFQVRRPNHPASLPPLFFVNSGRGTRCLSSRRYFLKQYIDSCTILSFHFCFLLLFVVFKRVETTIGSVECGLRLENATRM